MKFFFSFRTKMVLAISALMAVIFLSVAFLFVNEKRIEGADDIYTGVRSFAELTASHVADDVELYLNSGSFVYFNKAVKDLMRENTDVDYLKVVSYVGEVVYDSKTDTDKAYAGEKRLLTDKDGEIFSQIKAKNASVFVEGNKGAGSTEGQGEGAAGQVYFLKKYSGKYLYVDTNEKALDAPERGVQISYFVQPANDKYSVVYGVSYDSLNARITDMKKNIYETALFGFLLGIFLALFMSARVIKPVNKLVFGAAEVAKGNFKVKVDIKSRDELGFLGESFNKMAEDLGASLEARIYKERVGHELELARDIQNRIIPHTMPKISGLDISAGLIPSEEVGGDTYDFIPVDAENTLIYLGDVTGHGIPSGMVSAIANSLLYGYSSLSDVKDVVSHVNMVLRKKMMPTMFMTMCMAKWNSASGVLSYVNVGHDPLLFYFGASSDVKEGESGGIALGMVPNISERLKQVEVEMASGDVAVFYSDGIVEAWKNEKENYGMQRFKDFVKKYCDENVKASALEIKEAVLKNVKDFMGDYKQADDITIVVLKKL